MLRSRGLGSQHMNLEGGYNWDSAWRNLSSDMVPEYLRTLEKDLGSTENQRML